MAHSLAMATSLPEQLQTLGTVHQRQGLGMLTYMSLLLFKRLNGGCLVEGLLECLLG